jgi:hypothetical protein
MDSAYQVLTTLVNATRPHLLQLPPPLAKQLDAALNEAKESLRRTEHMLGTVETRV